MRLVMAMLGAVLVGGQAGAAIVTRDYVLEASGFTNFFNEPAPFASVSATFRVTYDDAGNGFLGAPEGFSAVTTDGVNAGPFSAAPGFGYFQASGISTFPRLVVGGAINGTNVMLNGTDDFVFSFDASATGSTRAMLSFTTAAARVGFTATDASVTPVAAGPVPEPATWAMLTIGFGLVGTTIRRGRSHLART